VTQPHRNELHRSHDMGPIPALLFATLAGIVFLEPAAAQQGTALPPTGDKIAPRGQRDVKDISYGDWTKVCFKPGGAKSVCRTSITGIFATGQMAVRLDIIEREGDAARRLQVFSPVGMYLPNPVELSIDQAKPYRIPYMWCLSNACIAGVVTRPTLVDEMKNGRVLKLDFLDSSLLALSTSMPLSQFSAVYSGKPSKTYEQEIDE
jgi:invasion protein IalB